MGLFGGSTTTTSNEKFKTGPTAWQKGYLDDAFAGAQGAYQSKAGTPWYQGDTYAGLSPQARASLDAMRGYAQGNMGGAGQLSQIGLDQAGYASRSGGLVEDYLKQTDPNTLLNSANQFANNPFINQQIDAVGSDIARNLNENTITGINRNASGGGNINSSRSGLAEGVARRGAAEELGQISANIRSNAWNQGLQQANRNAESRLTAADAFGSIGRQGIDTFRAGTAAGYGAFDRVMGADAVDQADRQGYADQDFDRWSGNDNREFDLLNRYYGIVGSNSWGQEGTSSSKTKTKQSMGLGSALLGAASTAAGIYTGMKG